jgi:MFS family permease
MLRVTQGVFYSGLTPALYAGVGRSGERRQELAVARTALTMGQILGPALCGAVLPFAGTDGALLIAAGLPAIGLLILISARGDRS